MAQESFLTLIRHAQEMLSDRNRCEADLIYHICKLDPDERAAIILGYQMLFLDENIPRKTTGRFAKKV
jgi:hypothetical protein